MADFRRGNRDSSRRFDENRGRSSGSREGFGGRGGGRGNFSGGRDSERRPIVMHDTICSKCGKQCQVPFRPSGSKPVYCSECFEKNDSRNSFSSINNDRPSGSGISPVQFNQINTKLDKILKILEMVEIEAADENDSDDEDNEDSEEDA